MEVRGLVGEQQAAEVESMGELVLLLPWLLGRNGNPLHEQSIHAVHREGIRVLGYDNPTLTMGATISI